MSISPRWMMVNGVKYQSHDEFWRLGELIFEEIDLDEERDEPEERDVLAHLELLPIIDWDLPSPVTPRPGTPRDAGSSEIGTPHSLLSMSYTNASSPSPRDEPEEGFWNTITNMSLEEMVSYVTGK